MSLFLATLITGLVLIGLGVFFLTGNESRAKAFPRAVTATWLLMGLAGGWFLYKVLNLSVADFGQFSNLLFLGFATVLVLSFFWAPDFLAVRGLAALILLSAEALLNAAYMQFQLPQRLLLVSFVYLAIITALYLAASPYKLRDFLNWLYKKEKRAKVLGGSFTAYGLLLGIVSLTYTGA